MGESKQWRVAEAQYGDKTELAMARKPAFTADGHTGEALSGALPGEAKAPPATGQPKDPLEAVTAGKPLMFVGADEGGGSAGLALGSPGNPFAWVGALGLHSGAALAREVQVRWNEHHDLKARVAELEAEVATWKEETRAYQQRFRQVGDLRAALKDLLPYAEARAELLVRTAKDLDGLGRELAYSPVASTRVKERAANAWADAEKASKAVQVAKALLGEG